jgi:hypothetical protein
MLSMSHAQQDAASHQLRKDSELSSCAKAPTDRAAPRGFILPAEALLRVLTNTIYRFKRVGLEAGPLSQWLYPAFTG